MKRQMAVFLRDMEYGNGFVKYLQQMKRFAYEIMYFSEEQACKQFLQKQKVELFILNEEEGFEPHLLGQAERVIYLTDQIVQEKSILKEATNEVVPQEQFKKIYQFQSMEQICQAIWPNPAEFQEICIQKQNQMKEVSIITVLNMEGISGKLFGAVRMSEALHESKGAIFLDLSQFSSHMRIESKGAEPCSPNGLSDIIYYLTSGELTNDLLERSITKGKGMDKINPVNHCLDVLELKKDQMERFIEQLSLLGYHIIIVVVTVITEAAIVLLSQSKSILYLKRENECSDQAECVKEQLAYLLPEESMKRISTFEIKEEKEVMTQLRKSFASILEKRL